MATKKKTPVEGVAEPSYEERSEPETKKTPAPEGYTLEPTPVFGAVQDEPITPEPETVVAVAEPEPTPADTVDSLVKLTKELSPEQQEVLAQLGFVIPTGDIESALRGEYTIGYWCPYCNAIALYFVGSSWNGTMHELKGTRTLREIPPLGVPIDKIAWTQKGKKASQINRHQPVCQQCGSAVQFAHGRTLKAGYLRDVRRFEEARDKSHSKAEVRKLMSEVGGDQVGGLPSNYDDPRTNPSQFMSDQQKADVTALAHEYDPLAVVRKE